MEKEPFITIVASHDKEVFTDHSTFKSWPHSLGNLSINPLFNWNESTGSKTTLTLRKLSEFYRNNNIGMDSYLPVNLTTEKQFLEQLPLITVSSKVENLISKSVLLDIPNRYMTC